MRGAVPSNKGMKLAKREVLLVGAPPRANVIQSCFAAYPQR